jgi:hypothetical protein
MAAGHFSDDLYLFAGSLATIRSRFQSSQKTGSLMARAIANASASSLALISCDLVNLPCSFRQ